ncbi:MAG TPA: hypothetical protein VE442_25360 [Jatrophihabitans sp.]|jgi:predicted lipoprotein with Yx(FWY)xxD motif|nr:hypothetical protein [Jatrophihabitans sp.]
MNYAHGWLAVAGIGAAALVAGCSSSGGTQSAPAGGNMTVAVDSVSGGQVLVDSDGHALYTSDQEASGKIICSTSDCEAIWTPLTVPKGQQPTGPSDVANNLGTVKRPDGSMQVTFKGGPLYTFTFDHGADQVTGDGTRDSFNGTNFLWHVATATGAHMAPAPGASTPGYGGGNGYGY